MSAISRGSRWWGVLAIVAGVYVLIHLAVTVGPIASWIFPTGIIALAMIAGGGLFFRHRSGS